MSKPNPTTTDTNLTVRTDSYIRSRRVVRRPIRYTPSPPRLLRPPPLSDLRFFEVANTTDSGVGSRAYKSMATARTPTSYSLAMTSVSITSSIATPLVASRATSAPPIVSQPLFSPLAYSFAATTLAPSPAQFTQPQTLGGTSLSHAMHAPFHVATQPQSTFTQLTSQSSMMPLDAAYASTPMHTVMTGCMGPGQSAAPSGLYAPGSAVPTSLYLGQPIATMTPAGHAAAQAGATHASGHLGAQVNVAQPLGQPGVPQTSTYYLGATSVGAPHAAMGVAPSAAHHAAFHTTNTHIPALHAALQGQLHAPLQPPLPPAGGPIGAVGGTQQVQPIQWLSMPNSRDIPKFVGHRSHLDPEFSPFSPELDVIAWLNLVDTYFASANVTSDHHKKLGLLYNCSPRHGDARHFVEKYIRPDFAHYSYDDVKRELLTAYAPKTTSSLVAAARDIFDNVPTPRNATDPATGHLATIYRKTADMVSSFLQRPNYSAALDTRPAYDRMFELIFYIQCARLFSDDVCQKTILMRTHADPVASITHDILSYIKASEKPVYRSIMPQQNYALHSDANKNVLPLLSASSHHVSTFSTAKRATTKNASSASFSKSQHSSSNSVESVFVAFFR